MSKFLLLHDNESKGKPAAVRADNISSVMPFLEARESVEEIYSMLNK